MLGFPFNISATAVASNFKLGAQLGFAKAHHKIATSPNISLFKMFSLDWLSSKTFLYKYYSCV